MTEELKQAAQAALEAFESRVTLNSIIKQYRIKAEDAHWLRASLPTQPAAREMPDAVEHYGTVDDLPAAQATPEPDDAQRRFEAGCVVLEYLRDIGAPYRAVHHMLIALHGDPEAKSKATPEPVQPRTFDARNAQFREHNWQIRFDAAVDARRLAQERLYSERERHTAEVKRLQLEIGRLTATPAPVGEVFQFHPMPEGWPARFRCDSCDGNGEIGELVSTGHFQPPERQTCPDCGGRGWTSEEHAFNADHMREFAEAHALLTRPAPGVPEGFALVPVAWPLRARVWKRESTQEWVLEIAGTLGDTDMNIRHTQPLSVAYENVPGLPAFYTRPAPGVPEGAHTGDDLPPAGKFVIAWVEGLKAPLRAMWVPDFHLPANEDADPGWAKYSEEHDAYFAPSGWYECNHCDETNWQIHERVLAWSHLPVIDRAALAAAQAKGGV